MEAEDLVIGTAVVGAPRTAGRAAKGRRIVVHDLEIHRAIGCTRRARNAIARVRLAPTPGGTERPARDVAGQVVVLAGAVGLAAGRVLRDSNSVGRTVDDLAGLRPFTPAVAVKVHRVDRAGSGRGGAAAGLDRQAAGLPGTHRVAYQLAGCGVFVDVRVGDG